MVDASRRRNAAAVADRRARFVKGTILALDDAVGDDRFDRVFAARVTALAGERELTTVARHLRPEGTIVLSFESPETNRTAVLTAAATLSAAAAGLVPRATATATIDGSLVVCLTFGSTPRPGPAH